MSHDFEIITNTRGKLIQKTKKHVLHDKFSCFNDLSIRIKEKITNSQGCKRMQTRYLTNIFIQFSQTFISLSFLSNRSQKSYNILYNNCINHINCQTSIGYILHDIPWVNTSLSIIQYGDIHAHILISRHCRKQTATTQEVQAQEPLKYIFIA